LVSRDFAAIFAGEASAHGAFGCYTKELDESSSSAGVTLTMKKIENVLPALTTEELGKVTGGGLVWHPGQGFPSGYHKPPRKPRSTTPNLKR
jgi:hypothetical protein